MNYMEYLKTESFPTFWCPGCGNGQILKSIAFAFEQLNLVKEKTVVVSGIGCWGKADDYITTNTFHGTHGRALAFATGIKLANPELTVVVAMGDGDGATIGGNHFIHAARRNVDVTALVSNNYNYGMTGGQYSGTTPFGSLTSTSPYSHIEEGFDICALALGAGAKYVARGLSMDVRQNTKLIADGIKHKGFSMIEFISPCPLNYGKRNDMREPWSEFEWLKDRTISAVKAKKMSADELQGKIIIGKLRDEPGEDYGTRYKNIIQAKARKGER